MLDPIREISFSSSPIGCEDSTYIICLPKKVWHSTGYRKKRLDRLSLLPTVQVEPFIISCLVTEIAWPWCSHPAGTTLQVNFPDAYRHLSSPLLCSHCGTMKPQVSPRGFQSSHNLVPPTEACEFLFLSMLFLCHSFCLVNLHLWSPTPTPKEALYQQFYPLFIFLSEPNHKLQIRKEVIPKNKYNFTSNT